MSHPPPPPAAASGGDVCRNCFTDDHWIIHNIKHRGEFKRVCTSCVLKLNPSSFCPSCFTLHDHNSLNTIPSSSASAVSGAGGKTLTCFKCSSLSHSTCVPPNVPKSPYLCPPCSNPSVKFFDVKKSRKKDDSKVPEDGEKVLDERTAKVFLTAAKIAAISMNKAATVARENAERRVRDAALARKRAKEAIDHVMALSAKFSGNKRRETPEIPAPVPISAKNPNGVPSAWQWKTRNQPLVNSEMRRQPPFSLNREAEPTSKNPNSTSGFEASARFTVELTSKNGFKLG